jgi:hypothetical protein
MERPGPPVFVWPHEDGIGWSMEGSAQAAGAGQYQVQEGERIVTRLWKKWIAAALVMAMIAALPPVIPVSAADDEEIIYFSFLHFSTKMETPTVVNQSAVDVVGTFTGVTESSLAYTVENILANGETISSTSGSGAIVSDGNTFRFLNVKLGEGLNRITVSGVNSDGNRVQRSCYVRFSNVPAVYDVKLVDGRLLEDGKPLIVTTPAGTVTLKAPNAKEVTVNGNRAYSGDGITFTANNLALRPGLNELTITARTDTMTYTVKRQLVYFNGNPTAFQMAVYNVSGDPATTALDGNPTVGPNIGTALEGFITGAIAFQYDESAADPAQFTLEIFHNSSQLPDVIASVDGPPVRDAGYVIYRFRSNVPVSWAASGMYTIRVRGSYGTVNANFPITFRYMDQNTPYITAVKEIYNPVLGGSGDVSYTSAVEMADGKAWYQLPIWVVIEGEKIQATSAEGRLISRQNNQEYDPVANPATKAFTYERYPTAGGGIAFKITNMPAGPQELEFRLTNASGFVYDTKTFNVTYTPAPNIDLYNIYNGKIYNYNTDPSPTPEQLENPKYFGLIRGKLVNFNLATDIDSVKITINGRTESLASSIDPLTGEFEFIAPDNMKLVNGPNTIVFEGRAAGIPITIRLTVYLFSEQVPVIPSVQVVPYDPENPQTDDSDKKFKLDGDNRYVTQEREADVLFTLNNADRVIITINGKQTHRAERAKDPSDPSKLLDDLEVVEGNGGDTILTIDNTNASFGEYSARLSNVKLEQSGTLTVVITASLGSSNVSQTVQITREPSVATILSPLLPVERVVNQNFLQVSILAEGADQVLLGKEEMTRGEGDIFRYELTNLKPGVNKIKYTVVQGNQKINGEFEVVYANVNAVGAQYKTAIPKSGTVSSFNGALTLKFAKDAVLRNMNTLEGSVSPPDHLFADQKLLLGIADKVDGTTVQRINQVGVKIGNKYMDGVITNVQSNDTARNALFPPNRFGYVSQLYWVDAGYCESCTLNESKPVDGIQPLPADVNYHFYNRSGQWLEPVERGTITIKYDDTIRDSVANTLGIWRNNGNGWEPLGGVVDTKKKTVTAPLDGFGYYAVFALRYSFDDVVGLYYARDSVETMYAKGIMEAADPFGDFGVYDRITRGEFASMLVKILDIPLEYDKQNPTFDDVPTFPLPGALWDFKYVETAARKGIVRGTAPRLFSPGSFIYREDAATMIARALNLKLGNDPEKDLAALQKLFTDANTIRPDNISSVLAVAKKKIITGIPNALDQSKTTFRFDPKAELSRADAAVIAERIMRELKKL